MSEVFIPKGINFYDRGLSPFDRLEKFHEFGQINRAIADARCGRTIKPVLRVSEAQGKHGKADLNSSHQGARNSEFYFTV